MKSRKAPKMFEVQCEASAVCDDLGCRFTCWCCRWSGPLCFNKSKSTQHLPGGHFIPPPPNKLYGDTNFPLQQDLVPSHSANLHGLNTTENLWSIITRRKRNTKPPKNDELRASVKATQASIIPTD